MGALRQMDRSLLVVACFSRHPQALDWAAARLAQRFGSIGMASPDFDFHHTTYYEATMGKGLKKRFLAFETLAASDSLAETKRVTNDFEAELASGGGYSEPR